MSKSKLTKRQSEIFNFISDYIHNNNFPPTMIEIGKHFNIKSMNGVSDHLKILEKKGVIHRESGKSRSIKILAEASAKQKGLPILGQIAAGTPILAEENFDGYLDIQNLFGGKDGNFVLKVKGESMIEVGIFNGDFIIVRNQQQLNNGEIGVFILDNEATVKRYFDENEFVRLQPENFSMQPIFIKKNDWRNNFTIGGKVIGVIRRYQK